MSSRSRAGTPKRAKSPVTSQRKSKKAEEEKRRKAAASQKERVESTVIANRGAAPAAARA